MNITPPFSNLNVTDVLGEDIDSTFFPEVDPPNYRPISIMCFTSFTESGAHSKPSG
jgi:hypothetical protein